MYENSELTKGHYIGNSMGTITMQVALSRYEYEMADWLYNVVLTSPCQVTDVNESGIMGNYKVSKGFNIARVRDYLASVGVYNIAGPNWHENVKKICDGGNKTICKWARNMPLNGFGVSVKAYEHFFQNYETDRFQAFMEDYSYPDNSKSELFPLDQIS